MNLPQQYLDQIKADTDHAIQAGWDASKCAWRVMAMQVLVKKCLTARSFTVNEIRPEIDASPIKTHDKRAMGGLMTTGKRLGWIRTSGDEIPSIVGHKVPIQIWVSQIYQETSARELRESRLSTTSLL